MLIGDDWFIRSMLIDTLSRARSVGNQKTETNAAALFSEVLQQYMMMQQTQTAPQLNLQPGQPIYTNTQGLNELNLLSEKNITFSEKNNSLPEMGPSEQPSSLRFKEINSEKVNQLLGGKLAGKGEVFIEAGKRYNIDPALLVAISQHETGNGKSRAAAEKNNIAGMMGKNGLRSYNSVNESIMDMARNLSHNYLDSGFTSITKIAGKYAPIGAANDPTGLNNHWVTGVTNHFEKVRG
ncbi:glucosaminidase domain-containing protein [Bacillus sp. FJAT-18017]|uniref:glucosaminidase domain-containing protein n=1 Tax=Bacillus sp. FJAT-18017 TaxID=1705566 RepID=UPI0006AF561B|nr:glucosaminidase domain-containing protein [Bacillus sp. FJAT-18017]